MFMPETRVISIALSPVNYIGLYQSQVISIQITIQMAREKKVKQQFKSIVWLFHVYDWSANKPDCGHSLPPGHNIVKDHFLSGFETTLL